MKAERNFQKSPEFNQLKSVVAAFEDLEYYLSRPEEIKRMDIKLKQLYEECRKARKFLQDTGAYFDEVYR